MSKKVDLAEKLQEAFEEVVSKKERRKYAEYTRKVTKELVEKAPKNKTEAKKIIDKYQVDTENSVKMFSVLSGVTNKLLNPDTRQSRQKLKPLEALMRVYSVRNPKSFANEMYEMTAGRKISNRNKSFKPLLLSYYDGFTESIEDLNTQARREYERANIEKQSIIFKRLEDARRDRVPIRQVKKQLIDEFNDPKRVTRALDTELHEQAERVKLEQSGFLGYTHKKWNTQQDERVRKTRFHSQVANKVIPIDFLFKAAGLEAEYPGDLKLPPSERINCRCFITYHNNDQAKTDTKPITAPPRRKAKPKKQEQPKKRKKYKRTFTRNKVEKEFENRFENVKVDKTFSIINDNVEVKTLNSFAETMEKYPVFEKYDLELSADFDRKNTLGAFQGSHPNYLFNRDKQDKVRLLLNKTDFEGDDDVRRAVIVRVHQDQVDKGWKMPIDRTDKEIDFMLEPLDNLNPTGSVFVDYTPDDRARAPLAPNMTTLDVTAGKDPNETVTIYRGTVPEQKEIAPGDFVTTNFELAKTYTGTGTIISKEVKYSEILDDFDEPLGEEYIYRPYAFGKEYQYTSEHEFGHFVHNKVITSDWYLNYTDKGKETRNEMFRLYNIYKNDRFQDNRDRAAQAYNRKSKKLYRDSAKAITDEAIDRIAQKEGWSKDKLATQEVNGKKIGKREVNKQYEKKYSETYRKYTSDYGLTDRSEFMAEHWASYRLNTKNPNPLSVEVGKVIEEKLDFASKNQKTNKEVIQEIEKELKEEKEQRKRRIRTNG